jgi:hypothetical protein
MRRAISGAVILAAVLIGVFVFHVTLAPAGLPVASCGNGNASIGGATAAGVLASADSGKVVACLVAGARACKPASIHVSTSLDTSTDFVLKINPGGIPARCAVTKLSQTTSGGKHTRRVTTTHCSLSAVTSASVTISCPGTQPYLIAPP